MMKSQELWKTLAEQRKNEIVVYTMSPQKEWGQYSDGSLEFVVIGAMGFASSTGLGLALAQPRRKVWVLDGDGSLLMNLGSLVTIAAQAPPNLVHFVADNGIYEISGRVPLPGKGKADLAGFARAAGWQKVYQFDNLDELKKHLGHILQEQGPVFVDLKVEPGRVVPVTTLPGSKLLTAFLPAS